MCKQIYGCWLRLEAFHGFLNCQANASSEQFESKKVSQEMGWFAEPGKMPGSSKRPNSVTVVTSLGSTAFCFAASGKQQVRYCAVTLAIDMLDAAWTSW